MPRLCLLCSFFVSMVSKAGGDLDKIPGNNLRRNTLDELNDDKIGA